MLHEAHARVTWPALLVVVADDVLVVRVGVLRQVALDQVARFFRGKPANNDAVGRLSSAVTTSMCQPAKQAFLMGTGFIRLVISAAILVRAN